MSRRQAATGLATGLALIVAAPFAWWATTPTPAGETVSTVNAAAAAALASPAPVSSSAPVTSGASVPAGTAAPEGGAATDLTPEPASATPPAPTPDPAPAPEPEPEAEPAPVAEPEPEPDPAAPAPAAPPARIELPALGVETSVVPVGIDDNGLMEIPRDVDTVGWYRFGPAPGSTAGSAVLSGHVDDYRQGEGVFSRIGDLVPGDTVRIVDEAGVSREFTVLSREEWSKGDVPLDRIFDRGGGSRLVLITCGGSFNSSTLGYDDNIAVTAVPVGQ